MRYTTVLAAGLLLAWPLSAQAQQTHRYRYESSARTSAQQSGGEMDFLSMMPGLSDQHIVASAVFRVTVKDSARGKVYQVTIDSVETNAGEMFNELRSMASSMGGGEASSEMDGVFAQLMAPAVGATIRRFVRDDKVVFQNASVPINGMQVAVVLEALNYLIPTARMTKANWNESWVDSGAVSAGAGPAAGGAGLPGMRTKAYTRWRVSGKDTLDAVISSSTEFRGDSLPATAGRAEQDSMVRAMQSRIAVRANVSGTRRVILDEAKMVKEDVQTTDINSNVDMGMAALGAITSTAKRTSRLIRLP